jgi:hypothetical protein
VTATTPQRAASPAAAPAFNPQQVISALTVDARSGYRTTEFWIAITTWMLPILALIFHRDLSSLAMPLSAVAAGGANAAYSVSRAVTKNGHSKAIAAVTTLPSVVAAAVSAGASAGSASAAGAGAGSAGTGTATAGAGGSAGTAAVRAAQPGMLDGSDTTELLRSMTAALQALTIAVTKIPSQPAVEIPAQPRTTQPRTTQPRTTQARTTQARTTQARTPKPAS